MIVKLTNPLYGSIVYLVRAVFNLTSLCSNFEYRLVQWQHIFYSLLTCYMVMGLYLVWFGVVEELVITSVEGCTLWIVMGIAMCWVLTNVVVMRINLSILGGMATALGRVDGEIPM